MTVNTTDITSGPYTGNGVTTDFAYTFRIEDKSQVSVYETDTAGNETLLTVDTNYTVAGIGNDVGGTITRTAGALPTGYTWYIRSNYDETQLTSFESQGGFFPDVHEKAIDKNTFLIQQLRDGLNRSAKLSDTYTGSGTAALPDPVAGSVVRWRDDLQGFENVNLTALSSGLIASNTETQKGSAAVANVFTLTSITYTIAANNLFVFRNGQKLNKGRDYNELTSSTIGLTFTPNDDDDFDFVTNISTTNSTTTTSAITHTESGTDYNLATYLQNRHVVNVKDYGAVGNNVNTDTTAIQDALNTGNDVRLPPGTYKIDASGLKFTTTQQRLIGDGFLSVINYTGTGTAVDFDGWAGCAVENLLVYSTTAAVGINIQPNSGATRFAHWWRLNRVMVIGTTPDWGQTDLGSAIEGFSTAGIRVERSYYGNADNCETSWCNGVGFLGLNEHNANNYQNCQTRNCNIGVKWDGASASNGSTWTGGAIENAVGTETAGIFIGESDRNNFVGTRMECSYGTHVIINPATSTLAQENQFIGVICGGTAPSYQIGDGTGTSEVKGTTILGGRAASTITINSDALSTRVEMSPTAAAAITLTDNGYGSIIHIDPNTVDRWYTRAVNANTNATNVNRQIAGGSIEDDYNDSYHNISFTNLSNAFRFENVNAGGTELAIMRFGAYRVWVSPTDGKMYISGLTPTTATDGTVVGTQT